MHSFKIWCEQRKKYVAQYLNLNKAKDYINQKDNANYFGLLKIEHWNNKGCINSNVMDNSLIIKNL